MSSDFGVIRKGTNGLAEYVSPNGRITDEVNEKIKLDYLINYSDGNENKSDKILSVNYGLIIGEGLNMIYQKYRLE